MNKRQWRILGLGTVAAVLVTAFAVPHHSHLAVGPLVEHTPGQYSQTFTDTAIPMWVVLTAFGLVLLTGTFIYKNRSQSK